MSLARGFLVFAALGLTPIALGYGAMPEASLKWLFGIDASALDTRHIFRAIMGLYLALAVFWAAGAFNPRLERPALWSLTVFMFGLAAGRALSLVVDGIPHPLLVVYLLLEVVMGIMGLTLIRRQGEAP